MIVAIRDALVALVYADFIAAYPTVPIVTDNAPFDWNAPPERFVEFEVRHYAGAQIGLSASPRTRLRGFVYVSVNCRAGMGSKPALELLDWFIAALEYKIVAASGVRISLQEADPTGVEVLKGWYSERLRVSFHADPA